MRFRLINLILLFSFLLVLPGCELIEDVFQFGFWFALFLIVAVIVILVLILNSVIYKPNEKDVNRRVSGSPK